MNIDLSNHDLINAWLWTERGDKAEALICLDRACFKPDELEVAAVIKLRPPYPPLYSPHGRLL